MLFFLWLPIAAAIHCRQFSCDSTLPADTCVRRISSTNFAINTNECAEGRYCSVLQAYIWSINESGSRDKDFHCAQGFENPPRMDDNWQSVECPQKESGKEFASGANLISCQNDQDCLMMDGSHASCRCPLSMRGNGLCVPHISNSDVYFNYWQLCNEDNLITDKAAFLYWTWYAKYWVYAQSELPCNSVFQEMQKLKTLEEEYRQQGE